jgi:hypothetical protein
MCVQSFQTIYTLSVCLCVGVSSLNVCATIWQWTYVQKILAI